jgi:hypothetical protein
MTPVEKMQREYERAVELGTGAHAGKTWYAGAPYTTHLKDVDSQIEKFFMAGPRRLPLHFLMCLKTAAWLHDAVEDTGMSLDLIERECGKEVRTLVWAVTDEPGANRKERHEKTYPKIKNVAFATALKLADRISNVEAAVKSRGGYFDMYRKEHYEFRRALHTVGEFEEMWAHLDALLAEDPSKRAEKAADSILAHVRQALKNSGLGVFDYTDTRVGDRDVLDISEEFLKQLRATLPSVIHAEMSKE